MYTRLALTTSPLKVICSQTLLGCAGPVSLQLIESFRELSAGSNSEVQLHGIYL